MIHTVKNFSVVNKAEVDVFLKFPCVLNDLTNVANLIFGRKAMTNLDSILKSKDITLSSKVHLVKAVVFSSHVWM